MTLAGADLFRVCGVAVFTRREEIVMVYECKVVAISETAMPCQEAYENTGAACWTRDTPCTFRLNLPTTNRVARGRPWPRRVQLQSSLQGWGPLDFVREQVLITVRSSRTDGYPARRDFLLHASAHRDSSTPTVRLVIAPVFQNSVHTAGQRTRHRCLGHIRGLASPQPPIASRKRIVTSHHAVGRRHQRPAHPARRDEP